MIKLELPFSMGRVTSFDLMTHTEIIDHPILSIGSSYACLKEEIRTWMTNTGKDWEFRFDGNNYCIWFETEQEKIVFILRWT